MNEEFEKYIKKLIRLDRLSIPFYFLAFFSGIGFIAGIIFTLFKKYTEDIAWIFIYVIIFILSLIIVVLKEKYLKKLKKEYNKPYEFSFDFTISYDKFKFFLKRQECLNHMKEFGDIEIIELKKRCFGYRDIFRISLYNQDDFNIKKYHETRKKSYNDFFKIFKIIGFSDPFHPENCHRYDFIFIDKWNNEIEKFVNRYANEQLGCAEFRMYAIIYQNKLIIRPVFDSNNYIGYMSPYYKETKKIIKIINYSQKGE